MGINLPCVHAATCAERRDERYDERARYDKKSKKKQSPLSALGDIMEIFGGE